GDACDHDTDNDGIEDGRDNCRLVVNPDQVDTDEDQVGDACDNCPETPNPGQEDRNADGSGDACQPTIEILDIREDGGTTLEVTVRLQDPDGDFLHGTVGFGSPPTTLSDMLTHPICTVPLPPEGLLGRGIAYGNYEGLAFLVDADVGESQLL